VEPLLTVEAALAAVLAQVEPLPIESIPLREASGRVLAEEVRAAVDLPPFPCSSMDGYAVRSGDLPGVLRVAGHVAAGVPESRKLAAGEAMEISTGGVVPRGADAVVQIEQVTVSPDAAEIEVARIVVEGENVRPRGGDVRTGATLVVEGSRLTPARLGALAACGIEAVAVSTAPRVAIAVTGTELRAPGELLGAGEIYESNGIMLGALAESAGARVERLGVAEDTEAAHRAALEAALAADVVITSGGVSVGPHDLVRQIERELGVQEVFWGVAMRPGKPIAFGVRGRTLVFGLPGNPVSALVGCLLFVVPALLALQGDLHPEPPFRPGVLAAGVRRREERDDFVRARVRFEAEGAIVDPIDGQESHMIARATSADALVQVPRGRGMLDHGSRVRYLPF
jgi:molybdopterin molybdotransferase